MRGFGGDVHGFFPIRVQLRCLERYALEPLHRPPALKAIMRRMRVVLRGDRLQFALQPEQRRDPLQGQRLVSVLRASSRATTERPLAMWVARTALSVLF
jgi:hypothetical protein